MHDFITLSGNWKFQLRLITVNNGYFGTDVSVTQVTQQIQSTTLQDNHISKIVCTTNYHSDKKVCNRRQLTETDRMWSMNCGPQTQPRILMPSS